MRLMESLVSAVLVPKCQTAREPASFALQLPETRSRRIEGLVGQTAVCKRTQAAREQSVEQRSMSCGLIECDFERKGLTGCIGIDFLSRAVNVKGHERDGDGVSGHRLQRRECD